MEALRRIDREGYALHISLAITVGIRLAIPMMTHAPGHDIPRIKMGQMHTRMIPLISFKKRLPQHSEALLILPAQRCIPRIRVKGHERC
jgi:hypothetical protein